LAAPIVLVTEEEEGPAYRMRAALQRRVNEEEDVWVQKRLDPPPLQGNEGRMPPPLGENGEDPDSSNNNLDGEDGRENRRGRYPKSLLYRMMTTHNLQSL